MHLIYSKEYVGQTSGTLQKRFGDVLSKEANALASKLKEQVAAREAAVKQAHDLLTIKAEEIKALNKQLHNGDVQIHDLQGEIEGNFSTLQDYTKLLDSQAQQLTDVVGCSS